MVRFRGIDEGVGMRRQLQSGAHVVAVPCGVRPAPGSRRESPVHGDDMKELG